MILLAVVGAGVGYYYVNEQLKPVTDVEKVEIFTIEKGQTAYQVVDVLFENGFINNDQIAKLYLRYKGNAAFQAGTYEISKSFTLDDFIEKFNSGETVDLTSFNLTIREGLNVRTLSKLLSEHFTHTQEDFINAWGNPEFVVNLMVDYPFLTEEILDDDIYYDLEGYLFPNTYTFKDKAQSIESITRIMLNETLRIYDKYKIDIEKSDLTFHQMMTMASIVELEGIGDADRAMIAGVFYNRLDIGMNLGSDVTTYYAAGIELSERDLYVSELEDLNAYNTRHPEMAGKLPVGPIANSGEASIVASILPEESDYLFFVADKNAKVYFTKTYNDHLKIIQELKDSGLWYVH
jgi:UPF0755 protein